MSDEPLPPSDHVPGIKPSDEITPHHREYMAREKKKLFDQLAEKIAKLKQDYRAALKRIRS